MTTGPLSSTAQDRKVIVTGAGNGLGLAIAQRFARTHATVLLVDQDAMVRERVSEEAFPKGAAYAMVQDLAAADAAALVFAEAARTLGLADVLINNAAWSLHKPMQEMTVAEFDRLVAANQRAPFFLAQEFLRHVAQSTKKPTDPAIVNICSVNALVGNPNLVAYAGTKGALLSMSRAMAVEMSAHGIRVNCISPSAVDTPTTHKIFEDGMLDATTFFDKYLIRRMATMDEIAELVCYLASPAAGFVTGANWIIDGGYLAR